VNKTRNEINFDLFMGLIVYFIFQLLFYTCSGMDVAILVVGLPSKQDLNGKLLTNLLKALIHQNTEINHMVVFPCSPGLLWTPKEVKMNSTADSVKLDIVSNISYVLPGHLKRVINPQFDRLHNCYLNLVHFEKYSSSLFSHVIRTRPDLMYDAGDLTSRDNSMYIHDASDMPYIALKAREIIFVNHTSIPKADLSFKDCYMHRNPVTGSADGIINHQKPKMLKYELPFTAIYDDQFAIMPRKFAPHYFLMENMKGNKPILDNRSTNDGQNLALNRSMVDHILLKSIERCYGTKAGPNELTMAYFDSSWENLPHKEHGFDRTGLGQAKKFCCERFMTWRLIGRLVPIKFTPFQVGLMKYRHVWIKNVKGSMQC
jgi:hypothetical protein